VGKTYLGGVLGNKAYREGYRMRHRSNPSCCAS
jgi:hypothetical protein